MGFGRWSARDALEVELMDLNRLQSRAPRVPCVCGGKRVVQYPLRDVHSLDYAPCLQDVALLYAVMAHYGDRNGGADPQPVLPYINLPTAWPERPPSLAPSGGDWRPLAGIRIGVYDKVRHRPPPVQHHARTRTPPGLR